MDRESFQRRDGLNPYHRFSHSILWRRGERVAAQRLLQQVRQAAQQGLSAGDESAPVRYNIALTYAIAGENDEGFHWLEEARKAGWRDYRWARIDPRLEVLRNDERFRRLLADVEADVARMRAQMRAELAS